MADQTFTVVATLADPLAAERLVAELGREGIEAFARAGGAASSAAFAQAEPAFWDLLVAEHAEATARELVARFEAALVAEGALNARAAEEEATAAQPADGGGGDS